MTENAIIDLPTGVVAFYMDTNEPRTPGKGCLLYCIGHIESFVLCLIYIMYIRLKLVTWLHLCKMFILYCIKCM